MKFLIKELFKKYKKEAVLAPSFKLIESILELCIPLIISHLLDFAIKNKDQRLVLTFATLLFAIALFSILISSIAQYFSAKAASHLVYDFRDKLLSTIFSKSFAELDKYSNKQLLTYLMSDCNNVQNGINLMLRLLLRSPFIILGSIIMAFRINQKLAFVFVPCILLLALITSVISHYSLALYSKIQLNQEKILYFLQDHFKGLKIFRSMNLQNSEQATLNQLSDSLYKSQVKTYKLTILLTPLTYILVNLSIIYLLHRGTNLILTSEASTGQVFALYNYFASILIEMIKLVNLLIILARCSTSASRIEKVLTSAKSDPILSQAELFSTLRNINDNSNYHFEIKVQGLNFNYPSNSTKTLKDINFTAKTGDFIGIIGSTASGKSSLMKILAGLYEVEENKVFINGQDITKLNKKDYHLFVSYVRQKAVLFKGSILDNFYISSGFKSKEKIKSALRLAEASTFVEKKDGGLEYMLNRASSNLSGGQKQRLNLARAFLRNSPILLLDDVCSALDYASEKKIVSRLNQMSDKLIILVSQRISSLVYCNKILLMDNGRIIGEGTHAELLSTSKIYREIYKSQFPNDSTYD